MSIMLPIIVEENAIDITAAQGTPEWLQTRCGRVTASRVGDLTARTKSGWSASRGAYMGQIIAERLTGKPAASASTAVMRWGLECEPLAKAAYEYRTDLEVAASGFVPHPAIWMSGASPDGLVGDAGLIEIKCPTTVTHIETLAANEIPAKHLPQIYWQMACTGRSWCDFVSFDPRLPEDLKIFIRRIDRDDAQIAELQGMVGDFLLEVDQRLAALVPHDQDRKAAA